MHEDSGFHGIRKPSGQIPLQSMAGGRPDHPVVKSSAAGPRFRTSKAVLTESPGFIPAFQAMPVTISFLLVLHRIRLTLPRIPRSFFFK